MKTYAWILVLVFSTILQVSVLSEITFLDVHYELFFSITVFMAIKFGWYEGCLAGIWCGLFNDMISIHPFGFSVLLYGLSGFIAASFKKVVFTQHTVTKLFILFIMSIASSMLSIFFLKGFDWILIIWTLYKLNILSIAAVNTIFSVPLYPLLDKITYELQE